MGEVFGGRYELVDHLGSGGMGTVWRVWDRRLHLYRAAKVLRQSDADSLLRFVREQSRRFDHPHIVAPRNWIGEDDRVLFTMDLVRGGSVATLLGDHGALPAPYVAVLLDHLLDALDAVHADGMVHRDIKPANLLLEATGRGTPWLRLSDFGIAVRLDEPRLTATSAVVGTPGYVSPEQLRQADPAPEQDLYAVGICGAEMLTADRPGAVGGAAPDGVPERLWRLLARCADPDPLRRPPTAADARRLLHAADVLPSPDDPAPWQSDPDPVEVFDQLPPLPPGWTPSGRQPAAASPAPSVTVPAGDRDRTPELGPRSVTVRPMPGDRPDPGASPGRRWRAGIWPRIVAVAAAAIGVGGVAFAAVQLAGAGGGDGGPSTSPSAPGTTTSGPTTEPTTEPTTQPTQPPQQPQERKEPGSACSFTDVGSHEQSTKGGQVECRRTENGTYVWAQIQ